MSNGGSIAPSRNYDSGLPETIDDAQENSGDAGGEERNVSGCGSHDCRHRHLLRHTLADAIEVLENTRKAFKSKQIEALRKKLTRVLIEKA